MHMMRPRIVANATASRGGRGGAGHWGELNPASGAAPRSGGVCGVAGSMRLSLTLHDVFVQTGRRWWLSGDSELS